MQNSQNRPPVGPLFPSSFLLPLVLVLLSPLLPGRADSGSPDLDAVVTRLQNRYETLDSLEARFSQVTRFEGFTTALHSKGRLFIKKGRLRWEYQEPSRQQIFVEDDRVLLYVPEHNQVIKSTLNREIDSQVPVRLLLAGRVKLAEEFEVRWDNQKRTESGYHVVLTPKQGLPAATAFRIQIDSDDFLIREVTLTEAGGNTSTFSFSEIRLNAELGDGIFRFDPPKGVVIIEQP